MGSNNGGKNSGDFGKRHGRGRGRGGGRGRGRGQEGWKNQHNWKSREGSENYNKDHYRESANKSSPTNFKSGHNFEKRERRFSYSQFIPESELGISEYICKDKKISGILKLMYSDFIVHEIDPEGKVVKLTDLEVPEENDETAKSNDCVKDSIIPDEKWQELTNLLEIAEDAGKALQEVQIDVTELDKDSRGKTHLAIREAFGRKFQSNTQDIDGKKVIVVKKWKGCDPRDNWKRGKDKQYLYFTVHKQDMDTSETVNRISEKLRFKPSNLNFAGTKDRRACTSQKMSLWHGEPRRLESLNIRNVWIGNYEFKGETIKLGQLKGNLFTIALREILNTDEEVLKNMTSLKEYGFINYFGTQRFGTNKNAPTHQVGKALLQGDFEKAVNLILTPRANMYGIDNALDCWKKEKDAKKALSLVKGSRSSVEVSLLRGLADATKNDYLKALNRLPRNLRLLYLHAYQSFIWNHVVSRRIRQFGMKTLPGDLVLIDGSTSLETLDADLDAVEQPDLTSKTKSSEAEKNLSKTPNEQDDGIKVRVISADEAEKIPIDQVVLPTPGFKVTLPDNEVKAWYSEMLAEDGLTIELLRQKSKEYSVGGSYRNFITKPTQLEWKIVRYKDTKSPLLRTDIDELNGQPEPQDDPDGTFRALIVKIGLDTSTYATIALRDVVDYVGTVQNKNEIADSEVKNETNASEGKTHGSPEEVKLDLNATGNVSNADKASEIVNMDLDTSESVCSQVTSSAKSENVSSQVTSSVKSENVSSQVTSNVKSENVSSQVTSNVKSENVSSQVTSNVKSENVSSQVTLNFKSENVSSQVTSSQKSPDVDNNALLSSSHAVKRETDSVEETPAKKVKIESNES